MTFADQLRETRRAMDCGWRELARRLRGLGAETVTENKLCRWACGRESDPLVQQHIAELLGTLELINAKSQRSAEQRDNDSAEAAETVPDDLDA